MSSRKFTMISPALFKSQRYLSASSQGRELFFYCLAGPHQTMIGCFRAPDLYIAADLGWKPVAVREELDALVKLGLIAADQATQEIMVERWFQHSQITTGKHKEGVRRLIAEVESDDLRLRLEEAFENFEAERATAKSSTPTESDSRLTTTRYMAGAQRS